MKVLVIAMVLIVVLFSFIDFCCVAVSGKCSRKEEEYNDLFDEGHT